MEFCSIHQKPGQSPQTPKGSKVRVPCERASAPLSEDGLLGIGYNNDQRSLVVDTIAITVIP